MPDTLTPACAATRDWVEGFVVAHNVCPFARRELVNDSIRFVEVSAAQWEPALQALVEECRRLDDTPQIETTLMLLRPGLEDFDDYLDFLDVAEALLIEQGYEGVYQLASFHPDYCFDGAEQDDPANFSNRSPWPMLHLLREAGLEHALAHYPDPEAIPERNIERMRQLGSERLAAELAALRGQ
ncbi:DUF1415 domain-containing protein [Billgrantia aerodenitrificans]|uniref:DUF1415 domain-containing protein n=1 Tax=Billgrantia aerodenitrificans TaxID=2733483 RepID=A0ABS9ANY9_9GAMM|nr:DUF1415 domain-containing protein [Halomonas aerodenitrificans]MCE8023347.1 DUF1415 domain-containing protein [Halomonas aerodenitrificans]